MRTSCVYASERLKKYDIWATTTTATRARRLQPSECLGVLPDAPAASIETVELVVCSAPPLTVGGAHTCGTEAAQCDHLRSSKRATSYFLIAACVLGPRGIERLEEDRRLEVTWRPLEHRGAVRGRIELLPRQECHHTQNDAWFLSECALAGPQQSY